MATNIPTMPIIKYGSSKTYTHAQGLSCCFRQHRAQHSHCRFLHGYALQVEIEFTAPKLDSRNWVIDFGDMKTVKTWLENQFDHKTVIATDDPHLPVFEEMQELDLIDLLVLENVGCEAFAKHIFQHLVEWLYTNGHSDRVSVNRVTVREHGGNAAFVEGEW